MQGFDCITKIIALEKLRLFEHCIHHQLFFVIYGCATTIADTVAVHAVLSPLYSLHDQSEFGISVVVAIFSSLFFLVSCFGPLALSFSLSPTLISGQLLLLLLSSFSIFFFSLHNSALVVVVVVVIERCNGNASRTRLSMILPFFLNFFFGLRFLLFDFVYFWFALYVNRYFL